MNSSRTVRTSPHLMECSFLRVPGTINRATFDVLCGVETLNLKGTKYEFAAWVIGKYKESGNHLVEIKDVPRDIQGSIEVLEFVAAHLNVLDLQSCQNVAGQSGTVSAFPSFLLRTSPHFSEYS